MKKKDWLIILLLAALKFVLPFLLQNKVYELHRDEYLYYAQGQHLDFGFLENPPLLGILSHISSLLGGSPFWIKFWPSLFGAFTLLITAGIAKNLGGRLYAYIIASLGILFTVYLRIHFLLQPNFLEIFFWTLSAYFLLRFINTSQNSYLYLLSTALSFGWWSKYSVLFFATAVICAVLLTKHRKLFLNKHFWLALLLGIVLIAPNVTWQYFHNWPLAHHMKELQETQLQYISKTNFLKEQLLMLLPVAFVWIGGVIWLLKNDRYRVIALIYLITVVLIMFGSGKGYYTLGAYPMLIAAGGVWLEKVTINKPILGYVFITIIMGFAIPFTPLLLPMQAPQAMAISNQKYGLENIGLLKWEDQKNHPLQQDFADMLGWKELAAKAENVYHALPMSEQENTIVYCRSYGQAGALQYYASDKKFRQKVISDNGSFLLWIRTPLYFKNLLFVGRRMPEKDDIVFQYFKTVTVMDSCANPLSRQYGDKVILFQGASDTAWQLANKDLNRMKNDFHR